MLKARKISPELFPPGDPDLLIPIVARLESLSSWPDESGKSVAMMDTIDPRSVLKSGIRSSDISFPTDTPCTVNQGRIPWLACTKTPSMKLSPSISSFLDDVPVPPLNS